MSTLENIKKGISAHGMWKQRLLDAIKTGQSEWSPTDVKQDNQCEFGKWLYSCSSEEKGSEYYNEIKDLHAQFHTCAGGILEQALSGKTEEATKAVDMGSEYRTISSKLTSEMMKWKKAVE